VSALALSSLARELESLDPIGISFDFSLEIGDVNVSSHGLCEQQDALAFNCLWFGCDAASNLL